MSKGSCRECLQGVRVSAGVYAAVTEVTGRLKGPGPFNGHTECCLTPGWTSVGTVATTG